MTFRRFAAKVWYMSISRKRNGWRGLIRGLLQMARTDL